jgi:hypothetical protein
VAAIGQATGSAGACLRGHFGSGLMELIVLNVGYELGILSPRIFAMMVLEELPGVGGDRLDVTPLPLGEHRVEGERF